MLLSYYSWQNCILQKLEKMFSILFIWVGWDSTIVLDCQLNKIWLSRLVLIIDMHDAQFLLYDLQCKHYVIYLLNITNSSCHFWFLVWNIGGGCSLKSSNGQYPVAVGVSASSRNTTPSFVVFGGSLAVAAAILILSAVFTPQEKNFVWERDVDLISSLHCWDSVVGPDFGPTLEPWSPQSHRRLQLVSGGYHTAS